MRTSTKRWFNGICTFSTVGFAATATGVTIYDGMNTDRSSVNYNLQGTTASKILKAFSALGTIAFSFGDAILPEIQDADELIVGLPTSNIGAETLQSYKVRGFVRGLAVRAADKGLRVYLQDEHGTSKDALDYMIDIGVKKSARRISSDAYSAVVAM